MSSRAPRKSSLPPWYISGSVQNSGGISAPRARHQLDVVHVGRAVGPLEGARQRRHAVRRVERNVWRAAVVQRVVQVAQLRRVERPVVEHALQRRGDRVGDRAVFRSRDTTISWPSRVPSFSVASFMGSAVV
jgi:hypothetical protein